MNEDHAQVLTRGRAYVRLIEAADVLLAGAINDAEQSLLRQVRQMCTRKLRKLVATLPSEVTAQILVISEKIIGPVGDVSRN